ncbi:hypothetical protein GXW78_17715 [Roseomonas terrae]|jgi:hypothetical protein|uniref:DUF3300 domain-containing protein n=1 Tax=Neoroseomonas terrae TaxID=424799 RepID=A0ABS5EKF5_9PROT|nr:hypothetical protein [Neoroseomonas terrae]MBR0651512.1 hypothetical protein [Neoroseomonas terrae]
MIHRATLLLALAVAACAPEGPPPTLPQSLGGGPAAVGRDPMVLVGQEVVGFFRNPQANQPAEAARAVAELEWLADTLPRNPRWQTANATGLTALQQARYEARSALGIPQNAPAQSVINGLSAASTAIAANNQAALASALPRNVFPVGPQAVVQRLSAPPSVPSAMQAAFALSGGPSGSARMR